MNHDCHPNAGYSYDETARVVIIFAQRNIQPGEDICLDYSPFPRLFQKTLHKLMGANKRFYKSSSTCLDPSSSPLSSKCEMLCPPTCSCYRSRVNNDLDLDSLFHELVKMIDSYQPVETLKIGEQFLEAQRQLNNSWFDIAMIEQNLFEIGIIYSKTVEKAKQHLERCLKIRRIIAPFSIQKTLKWEELLKNPEAHPAYLKVDPLCNFFYEQKHKKTGH